jgi:hypothetical protein
MLSCVFHSTLFLFQLSAKLAHNVSVVCDVFAIAIKEAVGFQQPQKCGGAKCHKGACADWRFAEPEPP